MTNSRLIAAALMAAAAGMPGVGAEVDWARMSERKRAVEQSVYGARRDRRRGRENPAGTKLWRQAMAGACTLRGRVSNGNWEPQR
jgi:hypothetical protein